MQGGDVQFYNNNKQIVVLNDGLFPASPGAVGWSITGPNVPAGTVVVSYRFGTSNPSSRYNCIFMDVSNAVSSSAAPVYYSSPGE